MAIEEMSFSGLDMDAFIPADDIIENELEDQDDPIEDPIEDQDTTLAEEDVPEKVGSEDDEDDGEDSSDEEQDSQPSLYSSLAKVLQEEGVLPSLESGKKITSVEDLVEAFRNEIKANEYADLTTEQKQYLDAIRAGLPAEQIAPQQSMLQNLKTITQDEISSNEELRKQLIYQDFILKGYSPEKAEKYTKRSIDIGEDESDATEALQSIIEAQEREAQYQIQLAEQERAKRIEEEKKQLLTFKKYLEEAKEFIPGVKINQKIAEKVFEQATKPIAKAPNGMMLNAIQKAKMDNPIEFESKLNYLFYITKGFSDFTKIAVSQKSKAVKELDDFVKGNTFNPKASGMGSNMDYTPPELRDAFDESMINNIR